MIHQGQAPKFKAQVKFVTVVPVVLAFEVLKGTWISQFGNLHPWLMGAVETRHVASSPREAIT